MAQRPEPVEQERTPDEAKEDFDRLLGGLLQVDPDELEDEDETPADSPD